MWMQCETWRPEIVHRYIGGPKSSRAPHSATPQQARVQPPAVLRSCFSPCFAPFVAVRRGCHLPVRPSSTAVTSTVLACGPFSPSSSAKRTSEPGFSFSNPPPEDDVPVKIDFPAFSRYDEAVASLWERVFTTPRSGRRSRLTIPWTSREYSTSLRSMASKASSIAA